MLWTDFDLRSEPLREESARLNRQLPYVTRPERKAALARMTAIDKEIQRLLKSVKNRWAGDDIDRRDKYIN
jgi:hypothetical protein